MVVFGEAAPYPGNEARFPELQLAEPPSAAEQRAKLTDTSSPIGQMDASSDNDHGGIAGCAPSSGTAFG
jgi:hypothetical protein